jgi:coniferyl-aldehyde dehydrogenase
MHARSLDDATAPLLPVLERQRRAFLADGPPTAERRIDRIDRALALLLDNRRAVCEALADDFGHRSHDQTHMTDVMPSVRALRHARRHVRRWMRPERRPAGFPLNLTGARARVEYQPKGVVGLISPWNFPVNLTFVPLAGIFAAGNRAMIKPSEVTPATSALMADLLRKAYDEAEVAVVLGDAEVGAAFARLPFDHLIFTGSTAVGRHVMRAAAENLVPVTLELGGKSPVLVSRSADLADAATKVMNGKLLNAGQICLAPDYALVPEDRVEAFVDAARAAVTRMYPTLRENPDFTAVVNRRHADRLRGYLDEARSRGARVIEINPANEDLSSPTAHRLAPTLVLGTTDEMKLMREEIFGPILPVVPYATIDDAIAYVNAHDRPLGLYWLGRDAAERRRVLDRTTSGGVTLNDVLLHVAVDDLPFGGIGPSGMGRYHGRDGFLELSHARPVFVQSPIRQAATLLNPPYGRGTRRIIDFLTRL